MAVIISVWTIMATQVVQLVAGLRVVNLAVAVVVPLAIETEIPNIQFVLPKNEQCRVLVTIQKGGQSRPIGGELHRGRGIVSEPFNSPVKGISNSRTFHCRGRTLRIATF